MFEFIRSLFRTTRVVHKTVQTLRQSRNYERELSSLPMDEFLPKWAEAATFLPAGIRSSLRPPATLSDVQSAEAALGLRLPAELKEFYEFSNGVDREVDGADVPARRVLPLEQLGRPGTCVPSLSSTLREEWVANGRDDGEPEGLSVHATDLTSLVQPPQFVLAFGDVDSMLTLESAGHGSMAVMIVEPHARFPIGTVLQIENGTATCFDGIRAWLASATGTIAHFKEMHERYSQRGASTK